MNTVTFDFEILPGIQAGDFELKVTSIPIDFCGTQWFGPFRNAEAARRCAERLMYMMASIPDVKVVSVRDQ